MINCNWSVSLDIAYILALTLRYSAPEIQNKQHTKQPFLPVDVNCIVFYDLFCSFHLLMFNGFKQLYNGNALQLYILTCGMSDGLDMW